VIRELTLATVDHPLRIGADWLRVDHPTVRPLQDGAPTLGWEGDPRLVMYLHGPSETFVVWRLEADGEYRPVGHHSGVLTPDHINQVIRALISVDQHRGPVDPYETVIAAQDAQDRERERIRRDWSADFADKLHFGLSRTHLPGIDVAKRVFPLGG
jgi:hypothetical protein